MEARHRSLRKGVTWCQDKSRSSSFHELARVQQSQRLPAEVSALQTCNLNPLYGAFVTNRRLDYECRMYILAFGVAAFSVAAFLRCHGRLHVAMAVKTHPVPFACQPLHRGDKRGRSWSGRVSEPVTKHSLCRDAVVVE